MNGYNGYIDPSVRIEGGVLIEDSDIGMDSWIKENSIIKYSKLGKNVRVLPNVLFRKAIVDDYCVIGANVILWGAKVGRYTKIIANSFLPGHVEVGEYCFIGPGTTFINDYYPTKKGIPRKGGCVVEDEVVIGANSTIGKVTIGRNSIIGMGSVVTKDVPPYSLAYGNPCQVVRDIREDPKYSTDWSTWGLKERV